MRFPLLILIGAVFLAGCETSVVKEEFFTLEQLKKTKDFLEYELVDGPNPEMEGPYRLSRKVRHDVPREARSPFHRRVFLNDEPIDFKHDDSIGYGFRFLCLQNAKGEEGVILLKTVNKVPRREFIPNAGPAAARAIRERERGAPTPERVLERLKQADTDGDGKIAKSDMPNRLQDRFDEFDANSDGFLDTDEVKKLAESFADNN